MHFFQLNDIDLNIIFTPWKCVWRKIHLEISEFTWGKNAAISAEGQGVNGVGVTFQTSNRFTGRDIPDLD